MKKTPIVLVLIVSCVWWYTSWYWYTCKIKWICSVEKLESVWQSYDSQTNIPQDTWTTGVPSWVIQQSSSSSLETPSQETTPEIEETPIEPLPEENDISVEEELDVEAVCEDIVLNPIRIGEENNKAQVIALERFLNSTQWELLEENGLYEEHDLEAVKRFQLKYKADILDPWDIEAPTGYVYKTTIQKINKFHCDN